MYGGHELGDAQQKSVHLLAVGLPDAPLAPEILAITPPSAHAPPLSTHTPASPLVCATAAPVAQPLATVQILLPQGAQAGQQVQFLPRGGQHPMYVAVPTAVAPQGVLTVQYPVLHGVPSPIAQPCEAQDSTLFEQWLIYAYGYLLCCINPLLAVCLWGGLAVFYYARPARVVALRGGLRLQRGPARASAVTALAACVCLAAQAAIAAAVGHVLTADVEMREPPNHEPMAPLSGKVNITLSGFYCGNGYALDNKLEYVYTGVTEDGGVMYRAEADRVVYIYYDRQCDPRDVPVSAWILGRKPDVRADFGLDKAPPVGCWNNALILSSDPPPQKLERDAESVLCGDPRERGRVLTADVWTVPSSSAALPPAKWREAAVEALASRRLGAGQGNEPREHGNEWSFPELEAVEGVSVNIVLSGFTCENGFGSDFNQKYIFQGVTKDGRGYYRGEVGGDHYIYYDRQYWILVGRRPDIDNLQPHLAGGVQHANAQIWSSNLTLPVGVRPWDSGWCLDQSLSGRLNLTVAVVDMKVEPKVVV